MLNLRMMVLGLSRTRTEGPHKIATFSSWAWNLLT